MKKNNNVMLYKFVVVYVLFYMIFYSIFFFFLIRNVVEVTISFVFIILLFFVYFFLSENINLYFLNIYKSIWIYYVTLLILLYYMKDIILNFNKMYLKFLEYKVYVLYNVNSSLELIFSNSVNFLLYKFVINKLYRRIYNRLVYYKKHKNNIGIINKYVIKFEEYDENNMFEYYNTYSFIIIINNNG